VGLPLGLCVGLQGRFAAEVMRPIEEFDYFGFVLQMMQPKGKVN
jgi:hypothetical protein